MHDKIDHTRAVIDVEHFLPGLPTVGRFVDAAVFARAIQAAERADIDDVGVLRMYEKAADLIGLLQAHVLPGLATVGRFIDAVAVRDAVARVRLTGADPDDIR